MSLPISSSLFAAAAFTRPCVISFTVSASRPISSRVPTWMLCPFSASLSSVSRITATPFTSLRIGVTVMLARMIAPTTPRATASSAMRPVILSRSIWARAMDWRIASVPTPRRTMP